MADYLLDTNHASPLVTIGHPLRAKILARRETGDTLPFAFRSLQKPNLALAFYRDQLPILRSGND